MPTDGDSPKEPIKSDKEETDQSPDSSQDIPSSISKLKRRLLSKCTPAKLPALPTPPTEQRKTPAAQIRKTPKDVLLTGQGCIRIRKYNNFVNMDQLGKTFKYHKIPVINPGVIQLRKGLWVAL